MLDLQQQVEEASELLKQAQRVVALTGAGISTESGIPDFRSPGSIWLQQPPVAYKDFITKPEARQLYWQTRRTLAGQVLAARPNAAHLALADLEKKGRLLGIITQNFDGLHHDAGNDPEQIVVKPDDVGHDRRGCILQAKLPGGRMPEPGPCPLRAREQHTDGQHPCAQACEHGISFSVLLVSPNPAAAFRSAHPATANT